MTGTRRTSRYVASLFAAGLLFIAQPASTSIVALAREDQPVRSTRIAPERAEVNLVLVDTIVRGKDGKPARGLTKDDFDLLIDRLPAPIATFESYCEGAAAAQAQPPPGKAPEAETESPASSDNRLNHIVLFFDINHLTKSGKEHSFDAALKYVREEMSDRDRVMLLAMKERPILLEPFTSDRQRLSDRLAAVRDDKDMLDLSYLDERLNTLDILRRECTEGEGQYCQARASIAASYALIEENKARRSLNALKDLMPSLAGIRGRKTLIHFSETLRDEPGLEYVILAGSNPQREGIDLKGAVQELHREANGAGVAFYMVYAGGLGDGGGTSATDASLSGSHPGDSALLQRARLGAEDGAIGLQATLSLETGGNATKRTNDLGKIFDAVGEDLSCYYVLGYANNGPGDGKRHSILVKMKEKGYEVRSRPYFEDWSESERLERKFRAALLAPAYYAEIPVSAEAYALAPSGSGLPILVKAEFPLSEVTLVGQPDGKRSGEVEIRGTVWTGEKETFRFGKKLGVTLEPGEEIGKRNVIYETGTELPPGSHILSVAVLDSGSWEIGASETTVPVKERSAGIMGDVILWTSSAGDILEASDAASVGIRDTGSGHGFVPRSERRFGPRESGLLYVIVCPDPNGPDPGGKPIEVRRSILAEETEVASFPVVTLGETAAARSPGKASAGEAAQTKAGGKGPAAPADAPACEGIFAPIPPGRLGLGGYFYQVEVTGAGREPSTRRAGFAVETPEAKKPGS